MSIPFFFEPVTFDAADGQEHLVVDGGVLSNFPVWLFDSEGIPPWPTFGYRLVNPKPTMNAVRGPFSLFASMFKTMLEAHDAMYIADADFVRTVAIDTLEVSATDFDLSNDLRDALYEAGRQAAESFLETWDFEAYKAEYRAKKPASRSDRLRSSGTITSA
jgi:NTE family protein